MLRMRKTVKLMSLLLAFVLVATSTGRAYGFVACEKIPSSRIHHENHQHGKQDGDTGPVPFSPLLDESDDSYPDTQIQFGDFLRPKRGIVKYRNQPPTSFVFQVEISVDNDAPPAHSTCRKALQGAAWTLRAHRTIVLLI